MRRAVEAGVRHVDFTGRRGARGARGLVLVCTAVLRLNSAADLESADPPPRRGEPLRSARAEGPLITRDFRVAARLGLATTALMFGLMVVGSVVRTTGSGLACPDWPLCHGHLIPPLEPHVLIEWFHRLLALVVGLGLLATLVFTLARPTLRARLTGLAVLALGLYVMQALLGALTVWKLLSPTMVSSHLAVAMLLFSTFLTYTLVADHEAHPEPAPGARASGLLPLTVFVTLLAYAQSLLGGIVSSTGAGAAATDWPTVNGQWLPPMTGLVGLHAMHRLTGYTLAIAVWITAACLRHTPDPAVRAGSRAAALLVLAQIGLGVMNVLLGVPWWVTALHIANAIAILGLMVATTFRLARLPAAAAARASATEVPA